MNAANRLAQWTLAAVLWMVIGHLCAVWAQSLGEILDERGWDQVIGTWVDEETRGRNLKITYTWRFEDTVVEIATYTPQEQTVALMGRNAKTGEIYHFGATSTGGGSLGKWDADGDDAVLGLLFTTGDGQEGGMRLRHHLVNDDTLDVTIEGAEPTTIRMVRAQGAGDEAPEPDRRARVQEQFERFGVPQQMFLRIQNALKRNGIDDRQLQGALKAMLGIMDSIRRNGRTTELDPQFARSLKADLGLTDQHIERIRQLAIRVEMGTRGRDIRTGDEEGVFNEGPYTVTVETGVRGFDVNQNLMVEENELEEGFLAMLDQYEKCRVTILSLFDEDGDKALNENEQDAARAFVFGLVGMLLYDADQNWRVSDRESDLAWAELAEAHREYNSDVLQRFDLNRDGQLSDDEVKAALERTR